MKNQDEPAFATSTPSCKHYDGHIQEGLTKLEYFSIHCLQGILAKSNSNLDINQKVIASINISKELLKQLENEN